MRSFRVLVFLALAAVCAVAMCACTSQVERFQQSGDVQGLLAFADKVLTDNDEYLKAEEALVSLAPAPVEPLIGIVSDSLADEFQLSDNFSTTRRRCLMAGEALARIKDPSSIPVLVEALGVVTVREEFQAILKDFGPGAEDDLVEALNTEGDKPWGQAEACSDVLASLFEGDVRKLLSYLESPETAMIYHGLIRLGKPETVEPLKQALEDFGDFYMAGFYLNCGNSALESAAKTWAKENGYSVTTQLPMPTIPGDREAWGSL